MQLLEVSCAVGPI